MGTIRPSEGNLPGGISVCRKGIVIDTAGCKGQDVKRRSYVLHKGHAHPMNS